MSHIIKLPEPAELCLNKYIKHLVDLVDEEKTICEADMYDYVLTNGQSNIIRLNYMLKDVDRALFDGFCDSVHNQPYRNPCDENGVEVEPENIEPEKLYPIDEHLEYVKQHPYFQGCNETEQRELIEYVNECHDDLIINKQSVFFRFDFCYKYLQQFRDIIFNEIERLKQQLDKTDNYTEIPTFELPAELLNKLQIQGFIENTTDRPLKWIGAIKELNYFVNKYFVNEPNKWKKTINSFVWNGKRINENSLKTAIDKYDNPPERANIINSLLS